MKNYIKKIPKVLKSGYTRFEKFQFVREMKKVNKDAFEKQRKEIEDNKKRMERKLK
jgi:hypothetical protein